MRFLNEAYFHQITSKFVEIKRDFGSFKAIQCREISLIIAIS